MRDIDVNIIIDVQVDGIDTKDYPDFCDAFISAATWSDTLEALTEDELSVLNDNGDFVYSQVIKHLY